MPSNLVFTFPFEDNKTVSLNIEFKKSKQSNEAKLVEWQNRDAKNIIPVDYAESLQLDFTVNNTIFPLQIDNSKLPVAVKILINGRNFLTSAEEKENERNILNDDNSESQTKQNFLTLPLGDESSEYLPINKLSSDQEVQIIVFPLKQSKLTSIILNENTKQNSVEVEEEWIAPESSQSDQEFSVSKNLTLGAERMHSDDIAERPVFKVIVDAMHAAECFDTDPGKIQMFVLTVKKQEEYDLLLQSPQLKPAPAMQYMETVAKPETGKRRLLDAIFRKKHDAQTQSTSEAEQPRRCCF